jgi:hypothetical protein
MNATSSSTVQPVGKAFGLSPLVAVEANAGLVLIPFVTAVLLLSLRRVLRARVPSNGGKGGKGL